MQYDLTEEQHMLQTMVARLAKEKVEPGAARRDVEGTFDWEMVELLRENGLFGIDFPEAYGGSEAGMLALVLTVEELCKVDAACGLLIAVQELGALPIMLAGNEEQKQKFLPKLAAGEHLAAFALTEPVAGSDTARLSCRAVQDGDSYVLNGTKTFISNGGVADILTVYALTDPQAPTHKNSTMFVVEKGTPGFSVGKKEDKMGIRWSDTVELVFQDCRVPAANRLGGENQGFAVIMKTLDFSRLGIAAQALGVAAGALEYAVAYAKERESFGKSIIRHQGVGFKLADMAMRTEAARHLLYKTAALYQEQSKDMSRLSRELVRLSAMAKCLCGDVAMWVATEAVQVLGGYGYIKEFPVERMMRDAKITQIYEGTSEIMRLIIANAL
ncbi:MAG TPA: acyl-CoA dehydrogenase family protein [Desulfobaccales bacterium]|nr:acyl-CoA dehydrogenase family protein [Desulfobaccales bacterium]